MTKIEVKVGESLSKLSKLKTGDEFVVHGLEKKYPLGVRVIGINPVLDVTYKDFGKNPYKYFVLADKNDVIITNGTNKYLLKRQ